METKVNNNNFITVQGWMANDLNLKGNSLLIYAIIYGFSQVEGQTYNGSYQYLADWCGTSKRQVIRILNTLVEDGLISKKEKEINGVKFNEYSTMSKMSLLSLIHI